MRGGGGDRAGSPVDAGILVLRLSVGLIMLIYGSQKMLGIFGGHGFSATVDMFEKGMGIPPVFAMLSIAAEFFGALGIIAGILTPVAAGAMTINMAVATFEVAKRPGALSDVFTSGDPGKMSGVLYPLLLCLASLAIALLGPGAYSVDAKLFRRK